MIQLARTITLTCDCHAEQTFDDEYAARKWACDHLRREHPDQYKRLEKHAREDARSQNGCGYFDSASTNGWGKAQAGFRQAWREDYMKRHFDFPNTNPL